MVPKLHITPIATTAKLMSIAEKDLKNKNKVMAHNNKEPNKNQTISFLILSANNLIISRIKQINGSFQIENSRLFENLQLSILNTKRFQGLKVQVA